MDKVNSIKRKSTIAVFEHVVEEQKRPKNKKFRTNRFLQEDSPSESELVIDDRPQARKKIMHAVKLSEEPLSLICQWDCCKIMFLDYQKFITHLMHHYEEACDKENLVCCWIDCNLAPHSSTMFLKQHISYHGYITKLINIGTNVLMRSNLPSCKEAKKKVIFPLTLNGYMCEWKNCDYPHVDTITELFYHMVVHVNNNPRSANENEIIQCYWKGCNNTFSTRYKLGEHIHVHTKEKSLACPSCSKLFSTKTKFRDHRKRQLATDLQSYQCSQCLKLFASERLLRDHMRSHINHYKCTMCDMTCPKPSNLAMHIRLKHIKLKHFKCHHCPQSFVRESNLKTHLLVHANHKFACEECDFKCRSLYGLKKHYGVVHDQNIPIYQCHTCDSQFRRGGHLTKHLMKKHNYHWPSGHSRFKYIRDNDGIFRLQTVRYESLEVTEEMIRSESRQKQILPQSINYSIEYGDKKDSVVLSLAPTDIKQVESNDVNINHTNNNLLITIEDVDEDGNVLNSEVIEANEIFLSAENNSEGLDPPIKETQKEIDEFLVLKGNNGQKRSKLKQNPGAIGKRKDNTSNELKEFLVLNSKNQNNKKRKKNLSKGGENSLKQKNDDHASNMENIATTIKIEQHSNDGNEQPVNGNDIKVEMKESTPKKKSPKRRSIRTAEKNKNKQNGNVSITEKPASEDIHYFSKEIILNYDKFKIVSTK